ncbi:hypothetical protein KSP39_PZI016320 [Platanthera zijinensis]|uniref:Uncharacterized protein n=1 Tax=Platanthera zijinensis TaxID=2320716 RepID=A0AAP0B7W0_9ASPA
MAIHLRPVISSRAGIPSSSLYMYIVVLQETEPRLATISVKKTLLDSLLEPMRKQVSKSTFNIARTHGLSLNQKFFGFSSPDFSPVHHISPHQRITIGSTKA